MKTGSHHSAETRKRIKEAMADPKVRRALKQARMKMTPEQRAAAARNAAEVRWAKLKKGEN
jgi:hypothetical protein